MVSTVKTQRYNKLNTNELKVQKITYAIFWGTVESDIVKKLN